MIISWWYFAHVQLKRIKVSNWILRYDEMLTSELWAGELVSPRFIVFFLFYETKEAQLYNEFELFDLRSLSSDLKVSNSVRRLVWNPHLSWSRSKYAFSWPNFFSILAVSWDLVPHCRVVAWPVAATITRTWDKTLMIIRSTLHYSVMDKSKIAIVQKDFGAQFVKSVAVISTIAGQARHLLWKVLLWATARASFLQLQWEKSLVWMKQPACLGAHRSWL
jgi:hypothetical protein